MYNNENFINHYDSKNKILQELNKSALSVFLLLLIFNMVCTYCLAESSGPGKSKNN